MGYLYQLIPNAFRILSDSYAKIGELGNEAALLTNNPQQPVIENQLIHCSSLYYVLSNLIVLNDDGDAIVGINADAELVNSLLLQLKDAADLNALSEFPTPFTQINISQSGNSAGYPVGPLGAILQSNGATYIPFNIGADGTTLTSSPTGLVWSSVVGNGIPSGGTTGQYLRKIDNTSYNVQWASIPTTDIVGLTATAAELNILDGVIGVSPAEINFLANVTSDIQAQLNARLSTSLNDGQIFIGDVSNVATGRTPSGVIALTSAGVFSIVDGAIVNADINASAAIDRSKLATGSNNRLVVNSSIGVITDAAAITADRVLISDVNGIPTHSNTSSTVLSYVDIGSSLTGLLDGKLSATITTPAQGDMLRHNGTTWINFTVGTAGQVLTSDGTNPVWGSAAANGLPVGGTTNQILRKIDNTNYNTEWHTIVMADVTDVAATAAELSLLSGLTATSTVLNYSVGVTSSIQEQLNNRQTTSLPQNAIWRGSASNVAEALAAGTEGYVLTIVGGVPTWAVTTPPGNVSGVAPSVDNAIVRWNGTAADSIQNSGIIIDDSSNMVFATATAIRTSTSAGNTLLLQAYDVDGAAYTTFATLTANNTPTLDFNTTTTIGTSYIYRVGGTDVSLADGGTGASLSDPGADRVMFWDDSAGQVTWLTMGSNLSISGTTLNATGGGSSLNQREETGTTYTIVDADDGYIIYFTNVSGCTVTLPNTISTNIEFTGVRANGAGQVDFTDDGTSVLYTINGELSIENVNGGATWVKKTATDFYGFGSLGVTSGGGGVSSVSGTTNRITSTGGATPVIDIAATYVGQASITTLGTIGAGTWQGTAVGTAYGGTGLSSIGTAGQLIRVNGGATALEYFTPTYISGNQTITLSGDVSGSGTTSITTAIGANKVLDAMIRQSAGLSVIGRSANTTGDVADITGTNNQVLRVSGTTLAFGSIDLSQLATVGSSVLDEVNGGTGQSTVTTGDLLYGSASNTWSKLAGVATGNALISGGVTTAPSWGKITSSHVDSTVWTTAGNNTSGAGILGTTSNQEVRLYTNNTQYGVMTATGSFGWGITSSLNARFDVQGSGSSSSTNAFNVGSAFDLSILTVRDDGVLTFGSTATSLATTTYKIRLTEPFAFTTGSTNFQSFNGTSHFFGGGSSRIAAGNDSGVVQSTSGNGIVIQSGSDRIQIRYANGSTGINASRTQIQVDGVNVTSVDSVTATGWQFINGIDNTAGRTGIGWVGLDYNPTITGTLATHYAMLIRSGSTGIRQTTPSAYLHLGAGTATAGNAPMKYTAGTLNTTAEAGAVEYDNTFYMTQSDATRRSVVLAASATKTTAGAPYTNDGYITVRIGGTDVRLMTTA